MKQPILTRLRAAEEVLKYLVLTTDNAPLFETLQGGAEARKTLDQVIDEYNTKCYVKRIYTSQNVM